jgi:histone deacetylase 1/2
MDTGATGHLTGEMDKLAVCKPYHGHDKVHIANGAGMHISHIGQAFLLTNTSQKLHLKNILHIPSVRRNLLSVKKLSCGSNMFVEFHPFDLFVKDQDMRDVLLRGRFRHGLYALDVPPICKVFSGVRVSSSQWHSQLGHPATPIVCHVLQCHELPFGPSN